MKATRIPIALRYIGKPLELVRAGGVILGLRSSQRIDVAVYGFCAPPKRRRLIISTNARNIGISTMLYQVGKAVR